MEPVSEQAMFSREGYVDVYPFTRQQEGEEIVIGRVDTNSFLSLSADAVEILDRLAEGRSIGEAQDDYRNKYGEIPDMEEFLGALAECGFVQPRPIEAFSSPRQAEKWKNAPPAVRYHFTSISEQFARKLFGRTALVSCSLVAVLASLAVAWDPWIVPGRQALYFTRDTTLKTVVVTLIGYSSIFIHEMGHLLAARAVGVKSRMGISNRLWILVAETDMTGLWSVPRRSRLFPILAGPLTDVVSGCLIILLIFATRRSWISIPGAGIEILRALIFLYMMRILWQFFLFIRTDVYFLVATFFGCKSLMRDCKKFLRNLVARYLRLGKEVDQSYLLGAELRVVKWYSVFWLVGRSLAFGSLFLVTLPVAFHFVVTTVRAISAGTDNGLYPLIDALLFVVISMLPLGLGLFLWLRSLVQKPRQAAERKAYV